MSLRDEDGTVFSEGKATVDPNLVEVAFEGEGEASPFALHREHQVMGRIGGLGVALAKKADDANDVLRGWAHPTRFRAAAQRCRRMLRALEDALQRNPGWELARLQAEIRATPAWEMFVALLARESGEAMPDDEVGTGRWLALAESGLVQPHLRLADLVPSAETAVALDLADAQAAHAEVLLDRWGLALTIAYGRGVTLLFSGPPWAGKTAAAESLASELGVPLLVAAWTRIEQAPVGKTEKNIVRAFVSPCSPGPNRQGVGFGEDLPGRHGSTGYSCAAQQGAPDAEWMDRLAEALVDPLAERLYGRRRPG